MSAPSWLRTRKFELKSRQPRTLRMLCLLSVVAAMTILSGVFGFGGQWTWARGYNESGNSSLSIASGNASSLGNSSSSAIANGTEFTPLAPSSHPPAPATYANWPTYQYSSNRSGYNPSENTIAPSNATTLGVAWNITLPGPIFGSVSVVNGTVYIGSWDGHEYALYASNGSLKWTSPPMLGVENFTNKSYGCPWASPLGVTSTAAVYGGSVYVGGFYDYYSLNASTGHINWNTSIDPSNTSSNVSQGYYAWSSPAFHGNSSGSVLYVGVASQCDNPLIRGRVMEIWASNGTVKHYFNTVTAGSIGSSVWSTPSLDVANNTLWVTTGNGPTGSGDYGQAIVALNATTLKLQGDWAVPSGPPDIDFGAGGSLPKDSSGNREIVATDKDGYVYALNRLDLKAGLLWKDQTTTFPGPSTCQPPGQAISPALFDGNSLYVGSSYTKNGTVSVNGSIRSVNPSNGAYNWETATKGTVQAAVAGANGLVVDVSRLFTTQYNSTTGCYNYFNSPNSWLQVLNSSTGRQLYSFHTPYEFAGAPAIADGRIFVGAGINDTTGWSMNPNHQGHVYAFGVPESSRTSGLRAYDKYSFGGNVYGFGNVTGGMPGYNYTWTWGDGSANSYGRYPAMHPYYGVGRYTAQVGVTDAASEFSQNTWYVYNSVYTCGGPGLSLCWSTAILQCYTFITCIGVVVNPIFLAAFVEGGTGSVSWFWTFGDGSSPSTAQYPTHTYSGHGTYQVTVQATDSDHHVVSKSFNVTV